MVNNKLMSYFIKRLKLMEHYNFYSPFPIFDTEYVEEVKEYIKQMKENKEEYDDLPVVSCKYCNSLYILNDTLDNDLCGRCGSVNEVNVFNNIDDYLTAKEEEENE